MEGKIQKMKKKFSKNFIVPNRSLVHTNHLYTYKCYVEHVGFTEKRQKLSKLAILSQNKAQILKFWQFLAFFRETDVLNIAFIGI